MVIKNTVTSTVIVLEFKKGKSELSALEKSADIATMQIIKNRYAEPYINEGYSKVYGIGIGFGYIGDNVCMVKSLGNMVPQK